MPNNVIREQQLQSVASAAQSFSLDTQDNTLSIVIEALSTAASLPSSVILAKTTPTLSIGLWTKNDTTYTTTITYDGDGELTTTLGTISNGTLSISDADGIFSGTISASEGNTYAATTLNFNYNTQSSGGKDKPVPTLELGEFTLYQNIHRVNNIAVISGTTDMFGKAFNEYIGWKNANLNLFPYTYTLSIEYTNSNSGITELAVYVDELPMSSINCGASQRLTEDFYLGTSGAKFAGYISNVKVYDGVAVHTSPFVDG